MSLSYYKFFPSNDFMIYLYFSQKKRKETLYYTIRGKIRLQRRTSRQRSLTGCPKYQLSRSGTVNTQAPACKLPKILLQQCHRDSFNICFKVPRQPKCSKRRYAPRPDILDHPSFRAIGQSIFSFNITFIIYASTAQHSGAPTAGCISAPPQGLGGAGIND